MPLDSPRTILTARTPRVRALLLTLIAVMGVLGAAPALAGAATAAEYRIEGRGWGHGIGMSQYGADGYAGQGWGYQRILRHYYTGTVVAPRPMSSPRNIRVLLQSRLALAKVTALSAGSVRQGTARLALATGDQIELRVVGSGIQVTRVRGTERVSMVASAQMPIVDSNVDGALRIDFEADYAARGSRFRGVLTATVFDGGVAIVNLVPMESYLRGVVAAEMPSSWRQQALRAQAVAARSYAETHLGHTGFSWFDMYSDTRSQVYGGVGSEEATTDTAIAQTATNVVRVSSSTGEVADTFFFSTSGGRTAANEEVWGGSPYSYLRSVPSPYETASQYFTWKGADIQRFAPSVFAAKLAGRFSGTFRGVFVAMYPSGYAKSFTVRGSEGSTTVSPTSFQSLFGLRSTFARVTYLSLTAPSSATEGARVTISGIAPVAGTTKLGVQRGGAAGFTWIALAPGTGGRWTATVRVQGTTTLQLRRSSIVGPVRVISPA